MNKFQFLTSFLFCFIAINQVFSQKVDLKANNSMTKHNTKTSIEKNLLEIGDIYFDSGSFELNKTSKNNLKLLVKTLKSQPVLEILIVAHTDSRGSRSYNDWLSKKRAEIVKLFLIDVEVAEHRIYLESFGEKRLKNKCSDGVFCIESLHGENRRVELIVFSD